MPTIKPIQHTLHLTSGNSAKIKELAEAEGVNTSAIVNQALFAYLKSKREGIAYSVALALTVPLKPDAEEKRREYLAVAQDVKKAPRIRIESYIAAKHDIPASLAQEAKNYLSDPDLAAEKDEAHYEETPEGLRYIPAGFDRYRLTREYWFDNEILTDPAAAEKVVQYCIAIGKDELAMRQRLAQMQQSPPTDIESAYEYFSRLHKVSLEEAASRIARGE